MSYGETYETRQVDRAERDALKAHGSAAVAAESYGDDVKRMLQHNPEYWDANGLIRLYARIAFRLAGMTDGIRLGGRTTEVKG